MGLLYHKEFDSNSNFSFMSITGLTLAKGIAASLGIATATGAAAVASGNVHGLTIALQHVPTWTHAHSVLSHLVQSRSGSGKP